MRRGTAPATSAETTSVAAPSSLGSTRRQTSPARSPASCNRAAHPAALRISSCTVVQAVSPDGAYQPSARPSGASSRRRYSMDCSDSVIPVRAPQIDSTAAPSDRSPDSLGDHRQVAQLLEQGDSTDIERVACIGLEGPDPALAKYDVRIAIREDVLRT